VGYLEDDMSTPTTLYRFYNIDDVLLYVGITEAGAMRWSSHRRGKEWWGDVARVTVDHFPDRQTAAEAEVRAIKTEGPLYNVMHSRKKGIPIKGERGRGTWVFQSLKTGHEFRTDLVLYGELELSAGIDDCPYDDGDEQLEYYIDSVRRRMPDAWNADDVPIYWCVIGKQTHEAAPFMDFEGDNFLSHYTWPRNSDGDMIDWFQLPVVNPRFPKFAAALGWKPSPIQNSCPLRSIWASRLGRPV